MIRLGSSPLQGIFKGGTPIGSVWCGDKLVYPDGPSYQRYKWLSAYQTGAYSYTGFMQIAANGTNDVYQPRESLKMSNTDLAGTWGSSYNDGYNWMAGAATEGTWRFTVTGTLYCDNLVNKGYTQGTQIIYGGYMVQTWNGGPGDEFFGVTWDTYTLAVGEERFFSYTFDVVKPVSPRNWYFLPLAMSLHSENMRFDIYDLVIGASKIA